MYVGIAFQRFVKPAVILCPADFHRPQTGQMRRNELRVKKRETTTIKVIRQMRKREF